MAKVVAASTLLALVIACCPATAWAAGTVTQVRGHGLLMTVDSRWVSTGGYRPVSIEIVPNGPAAADRTLTLQFRSEMWSRTRRTLLVEQDVEIPAGATRVDASASLTNLAGSQSFDLQVFEDGKHLKNLRAVHGLTSGGYSDWEGLPSVLVVGDVQPDTGSLAQVLPIAEYSARYGNRPVTTVTKGDGSVVQTYQLDSAIALPAARLPTRWLDYSGVDLLCLTLADIHSLRTNAPGKLQAIRRWVHSGGTLLVSGMQTDWSGLPQLEAALASSATPGNGAAPPEATWKDPDPSNYNAQLLRRGEIYNGLDETDYGVVQPDPFSASMPAAAPGEATAASPATGVPATPAPQAAIPAPHFRTRPLGMGLVVALAPDQIFPGTPEEWGWVLNEIGANRWIWSRRHGQTQQGPNPDFWNFWIAGVGLAPVTAFRVLITLFVVGIGPVNYFLLWRKSRLHLLLFTVPVCALAVTGSLFAYAMIADGLGVRIRARSYTRIDQPNGMASNWSRTAYYAGLAPSGGLSFPEDVVVLPLQPNGDYDDSSPSRTVVWDEQRQHLASGWLGSRTPTQYLLLRSRPSTAELRFIPPGKTGDAPKVENRLGTRIRHLLVVDPQGEVFGAANVDRGETKKLDAANAGSAFTFGTQWAKNMPALPEGFDPNTHSAFFGTRYYNYGASYNNLTETRQATGLLETGLSAAAASPSNAKIPRTYAAIVDRSPEVDYGLEGFQEEDSFHVIVGNW